LFHFIRNIEDQPVGGKARGLKVMKDLGLRVPDSFVIIHPNGYDLPVDQLMHHLSYLGEGPKAVRSSAVSEDGFHASFAGQFESYLNVTGPEEIRKAIRKCVEAAYSDRVAQYAGNIHHKADTRISVIIQNMVRAEKSGVIFSADPVSNRRDRMVVNASTGIGDDLVSGRKDAVQYVIYRSGRNIPSQLRIHGGLLSAEQLHELMEGARKAERSFGHPVDMEWAIDGEGLIHWLQVRPVTALGDVHFNELDDVKGESRDVWSLGNIGEMMPGAITPLTYSVSGRTIDIGLGYLAARSGVIPMKKFREFQTLQLFYNRLFFNMSRYMIYAEKLALNRKENILISLSAEDVPELVVGKPDPAILRYPRLVKQITTIQFAGGSVKRILALERSFRLDMTGDLQKDIETLDYAFEMLVKAFCCHNLTSAQSGYYYSVMMGILTKNKRPPGAGDHHLCTLLLEENPGIESADAVKSLERFAALVRESGLFADEFVSLAPAEALALLNDEGPEHIRSAYNHFLERHGHRCIRESELRERPWEEDQEHLISMIQASLKAGKPVRSRHDSQKELEILMQEQLNPVQRFFVKLLGKPARKAVANREMTKSASMKMINETRKAYRKLAETLVMKGLLDDTDQVWFLTRDEIRQLVTDRSPAWKSKASGRRVLLPETAKLRFPLMNIGIPEPLEEEEVIEVSGNVMRGIPVSTGTVTGRARIVNTLEEASLLEKGEIMVVSFTDIGWTPYFSLISGLVTEIGSPLSHGAVVAREYGIPAVVSVKGARSFIKTGDTVLLDGARGTVEVQLKMEN
jgi:rifampicin phosphotransferase